MSLTTSDLAALKISGLIIHQSNSTEPIFERTAEHAEACVRFEKCIDLLHSLAADTRGIGLLNLIVYECILNQTAFLAIAKGRYKFYRADANVCIEWSIADEWIDRRILSTTTSKSFEDAQRQFIDKSSLKQARAICATFYGSDIRSDPFTRFIADAAAWWVDRQPGPLFLHAIGIGGYQLLSQKCWARYASKMPLMVAEKINPEKSGKRLQRIQGLRGASTRVESLNLFILQLRKEVNTKQAAATVRKNLIERIDELMPTAEAEGSAQAIVLAATEYLICNGGIAGTLFAPTTLRDYFGIGLHRLVKIVRTLQGTDCDGMDWWNAYTELLKQVADSQAGKFASFLEAFHHFQILLHEAPLTKRLYGTGPVRPPAAAVVWPHEMPHALKYVEVADAHPRVRLQARVGLLLSNHMPLRPSELMCIRMQDVHLGENNYLAIYPRQRDGTGKTPALRRTEDLHDASLLRALFELQQERIKDDAEDEDFLFGHPGHPGCVFEEAKTSRLMKESLVWATGDISATTYDLRHTAFTFRALRSLAGKGNGEVMQLHQVSAEGGHAGPNSTRSYLHIFEFAFRNVSSSAFPNMWREGHNPITIKSFADGVTGYVAERSPLSPKANEPPILKTANFKNCLLMFNDIASDQRIQVIARKYELEEVSVQARVDAFHAAAALAGLAAPGADARQRRLEIVAMQLWARTAQQPKHSALIDYLSTRHAKADFQIMRSIFLSWVQMRQRNDISLRDPDSSQGWITHLLQAGYFKRSLLVDVVVGANVPAYLKSLNLPIRHVSKPRKGRAPVRLFVCPSNVDVLAAEGATVSMVGFHWIMLAVGAELSLCGEL